jgi:hypothetical protein
MEPLGRGHPGWLKVYNERCEPKWNEKELAHKAAEAARSAHDKPRGHLIGEQEKEQPKQTEKLLGKPIASGKISATLATLKTDLSSSYTHAHAYMLSTATRKESEINVANVAKRPKTTDATTKIQFDTPQMADPSLARGGQATPEQPDTERIASFLKEVIIREDGALCAFHYLFDRYRKWRATYGLLATQFDQAQFAAEMQLLAFYAEVIRTPADQVSAGSPVIQAYEQDGEGRVKLRICDKAAAGAQLAKMCGWNESDQVRLSGTDSLSAYLLELRAQPIGDGPILPLERHALSLGNGENSEESL